MANTSLALSPTAQRRLSVLGENLRLARLRRELSAEMVSERAGIRRQTRSSLESGNGSVSMAIYVQAPFVLGLEQDLALLARDDELEPAPQDAKLSPRKRARRLKPKGLRGFHSDMTVPGFTVRTGASSTPSFDLIGRGSAAMMLSS